MTTAPFNVSFKYHQSNTIFFSLHMLLTSGFVHCVACGNGETKYAILKADIIRLKSVSKAAYGEYWISSFKSVHS